MMMRSNTRSSSALPSAPSVTHPSKAIQARPSRATSRQPRYPRGGARGRFPAHGGSLAQSRASLSPNSAGTSQVGSGRPEKMDTPALQPSSADLDVSMFDDHEGAEVDVGTSVGCAWVRDQIAAVVPICRLRAARFV